MDKQEYIELNTLLTKLRVICMKSMGEIDTNLNADNMRISRRMREENVSMIRSIDNIKRFMPLKREENSMSLYNMLFGTNEDTPVLLGIIEVNKEYFDRFRDVELTQAGEVIRVLTRLGGGNREDYKETWQKIRNHKLYIKDYDDDFDKTYAYIDFNVPEKYLEITRKMFKGEPESFENKFKKELEDMDKPGTKANENAEKIANIITNAIKDGNNFIGL